MLFSIPLEYHGRRHLKIHVGIGLVVKLLDVQIDDLAVVVPEDTRHSVEEAFDVVDVVVATVRPVELDLDPKRHRQRLSAILAPGFPAHRVFVGPALGCQEATAAAVGIQVVGGEGERREAERHRRMVAALEALRINSCRVSGVYCIR